MLLFLKWLRIPDSDIRACVSSRIPALPSEGMPVEGVHFWDFQFPGHLLGHKGISARCSLPHPGRWDPAPLFGIDTWALCVARGVARETPHLSPRSPHPPGGLQAPPLGLCVPQPRVWGLCEQDILQLKEMNIVYKLRRISFPQHIVMKNFKRGRVERRFRVNSDIPIALLLR